ncbi:LOW QUALITY PROTEIN: hypothetical protein BRADI_5g02250v3 [Brachypodium distachyon]|uniref:Serpin domain-containing protein n=1 Tax=Brachypodium distachyon TaxID=15368 RepID=A0A0Q3GLQ6_BRADI|nr:LOW QUALITY PROTEIN: hypothetical protein BRADI_5g02250v3 [Brachypodium distachyon]
MEDTIDSLKAHAVRRFPKLSRWISTEAAARSGLQSLALGLNKRLADDARRSGGNLVFSPLSVYAALSLVAAGARDRTLSELLGVLGAPSREALAGHVSALTERALADQAQTGGPKISFACGSQTGLWRLTDKMDCRPEFLLEHLPGAPVPVGDFRLPRFKISFSAELNDVLKDMGVREAFEQGKADLSDMAADESSGRRLALQQVIHKAVMEVNEEGPRRPRYCGLEACCRNSPPEPVPVDFVADHPFAFFVIEELSGAILFAGHVLDPSIG